MNVLVIDGQGGGLGRQLVAAISAACPEARLTAVGTNSLATSAISYDRNRKNAYEAVDAGKVKEMRAAMPIL